MASVPLTFLFVALVILLGFVTSRIFQATRFPDIPLLLSLGLILGPLNRAAADISPVLHSSFLAQAFDEATFRQILPFLSQLALIVILFDSGLKLNIEQVAKGFKPALLHTIPTMLLTVTGIAVVAQYVWGMPTLVAVVLGVALSNVGQTVSAAIIREISITPDTRSIYFVEMAIYDVISIPLLVGLLEFAKTAGTPNVALFGESIARVVSVSVMFGVVGGLIWIYVLLRLENYPYTYMVTLASLLLVYSLNSFAGGSGAISALIFGLVVGNRGLILKMGGFQRFPHFEIEGEKVHTFHDEMTFFIRSFFFVFLGIIFSTGARADGNATTWSVSSSLWPFAVLSNTATLFLIGCLLIFVAIVAIRWFVVRYVSARSSPDRLSLWAVYGRGLGTAVLCAFPFTLAAYLNRDPVYYPLFRPYEEIFFNVALMTILLTVVGTSVTVYWEEHRIRRNQLNARRAETSVKE
jgi:potassium/hydrogen antiporter